MSQQDRFCVLLGQRLTSRARSPKLWSAAFEAHGLMVEMRALNVHSSQVAFKCASLSADERFLGGAVAAPHKPGVAEFLWPRLDDGVHVHGCVNCIYRGADMVLRGANTDGLGAIRAIEEHWGAPLGWSGLVLGLGGVGKPVAQELSLALKGNLTVASRRVEDRRFAELIGAEWLSWDERGQVLSHADLIVNCTSVGSGEQVGLTPLSQQDLARTRTGSKVFDVIYDPCPSKFLELAEECGLEVLDGKSMNLFQAELAFAKCFPQTDRSITAEAMARAFALL